jgi:hypothetical protein
MAYFCRSLGLRRQIRLLTLSNYHYYYSLHASSPLTSDYYWQHLLFVLQIEPFDFSGSAK